MKTYSRLKLAQRLVVVAVVVSVHAQLFQARAQTTTNEDVQLLIRRIDELEQKVKVLERTHEIDRDADKEATAEKAKVTPTVTLGSGGLVVRSADSNFIFNAHGYMQTDGRFYLGQKTVNDTFLLRRVRPIFEGTVYNKFDYRLMMDFASGVTSPGTNNNSFITDAYLNARLWPQFQVQAGKFKTPFGLERMQSTANLPFVETGFATQFTPNYEVGAIIHNGFRSFDNTVNYAVGILNGIGDGGSDDMEATDEGKEAVARLFVQPFLQTDVEPLRGLGLGVAGTYEYRAGSTRGYTTPGQQTFFAYTNGVAYSGHQYRIDPQAYYYWRSFGLLGEYVISSQDVVRTGGATAGTARFDNRAWQVIGSWYLTGEDNSFSPVPPLHPFGLDGGGWGALEVVGRYGQVSLDHNIFPLYASSTSAQGATSWGAGLNWHLNRNILLQLDYEQTRFKNGVGGVGSATAKDEHVILTRAQLSF